MKIIVTRCALVLLLLSGSADFVRAQNRSADTAMNPVSRLRISLTGAGALRGATRVVVPTALLHLAVDGAMRTTLGARSVSPQFRGNYRTAGLRKEFVQELAEEVRRVLVKSLTDAGLHVIADDSLKSHPDLRIQKRLKIDTTYGTPIVSGNTGRTTYSIVSPSLAQIPAGGTLRKEVAYRQLAKSLGEMSLFLPKGEKRQLCSCCARKIGYVMHVMRCDPHEVGDGIEFLRR